MIFEGGNAPSRICTGLEEETSFTEGLRRRHNEYRTGQWNRMKHHVLRFFCVCRLLTASGILTNDRATGR